MKTLMRLRVLSLVILLIAFVINILSSNTLVAQENNNIIVNGDFSTDDLSGWSTFLADWEGVSGNFSVVAGEASITGIRNALNVVWHVQLNQELSANQINALNVGETYLISFQARSNVAGRPLRLFFGQNEGEFTALKTVQFELSTEMETYVTTVLVTRTFSAMKLGFEAGLSNADVIIDNVSLVESNGPAGLNLPITFDDESINYELSDFGGNSSQIIADPTNENNTVVRSVKMATAEIWAGTTVGEPNGFTSPIPFSQGNTTMSVRVWSPMANVPVRLKVEMAGNPTISVEAEVSTTVAEEWETLIFDFSSQAAGTATINFAYTYNKASIFFNFGTTGAAAGELVFYWDDLIFGGDASDIAPSTPDGFVGIAFIGEIPVGSGEVFLAVGPNNVQLENIRYRLFYSRTNNAPLDPKDASEYSFGNTTGDGNGNNAFGFVITGLDPGTRYTFWLYQYNTQTGLYSEVPASITVVSGGQSTSIEDTFSGIPTEVRLSQNYPNPFNPTTQIRFAIPEAGYVRMDVFNTMGQIVATLVDESRNVGNYMVTFDAGSLASGIYLVRLQAGSTLLTNQMMLIK